ncbi:hypothetical protein DSO57_1026889 [Entomophthora muscae]|uniref:Uncharacterized protein n=1 Tax=Entomophthora muscae TaxID=34485 RepID=A0ACC2TD23_9FUNG|nr:hypothetical protein DSO57_1026889 [Entomophthora muscae]
MVLLHSKFSTSKILKFSTAASSFNNFAKAKVDRNLFSTHFLADLLKSDISLWRTNYPNGEANLISIYGLPLCFQRTRESLIFLDTCIKLSPDLDELCIFLPTLSLEHIWIRAIDKGHIPSLFKILRHLYKNKKISNYELRLPLESESEEDFSQVDDCILSEACFVNKPSALYEILGLNFEHGSDWAPSESWSNSAIFWKIKEKVLTQVALLRTRPQATKFGLPVKENKLSILECQLFKKAKELNMEHEALFISPHFSLPTAITVLSFKNEPATLLISDISRSLSFSRLQLPVKEGRFGPHELELFEKLYALGFNPVYMSFIAPVRTCSQLDLVRFRLKAKPLMFATGPWSPQEKDALVTAVGLLDKNLPQGKKRPPYFWGEVSKRVSSRSSRQCQAHWRMVVCTKTKKYVEFTLDEDLVICSLPIDTPLSVIKEVLPGRTAEQFRLRRRAITSITTPWSSSELEKLEGCVEFFGSQNYVEVSNLVGSHTSRECMAKWLPNRYTAGLNSRRAKGPFTNDEQIIFSRLSILFRKKINLQIFFPGRSSYQIYRHSSSLITQRIDLGRKFSNEKLFKLLDLFISKGFDWQGIAKEFPPTISPYDCASYIKFLVLGKTRLYIPPTILEPVSIKFYQGLLAGNTPDIAVRDNYKATTIRSTRLKDRIIAESHLSLGKIKCYI